MPFATHTQFVTAEIEVGKHLKLGSTRKERIKSPWYSSPLFPNKGFPTDVNGGTFHPTTPIWIVGKGMHAAQHLHIFIFKLGALNKVLILYVDQVIKVILKVVFEMSHVSFFRQR